LVWLVKEDPMAKALSLFSITPSGDGYELHIEDEDGEVLELVASFEQLDLISEEIDRQLDDDEDEQRSVDEEPSDEDEE